MCDVRSQRPEQIEFPAETNDVGCLGAVSRDDPRCLIWIKGHLGGNLRGESSRSHEAVRRELAAADPHEAVWLCAYSMFTGSLDSRARRPTRVARKRSETGEGRHDVASRPADVEGAIDVRQDLVPLGQGGGRSVGRATVL